MVVKPFPTAVELMLADGLGYIELCSDLPFVLNVGRVAGFPRPVVAGGEGGWGVFSCGSPGGLVLGVDEFVYRLAEVGDQVAELVDAGFGELLQERLVGPGGGGVDAVEGAAAGRGQLQQR